MGAFRDILEACGVWLSSASLSVPACLTASHRPLTDLLASAEAATALTPTARALTLMTATDECDG